MQQLSKTHQSLERALEVLLYFRPHNAEAGTIELSQKLGLHKSTVSRILAVLKNYGFLQQNPENRNYSLGPSIADLGASLRRSLRLNFTLIAKPYLDELRNTAGETVVLELPLPDRTVLAYVVEGLGPVRIRGTIGDRHYYHTSAGGKAILAFTDPDHRASVLSQQLEAVTPCSLTHRTEFEKELAVIRRTGFAFDRQENNTGIQAFGAPVFDHEGKPAAAVVIAGAAQNVTWERKEYFVSLLKGVASKISEQLFFNSSNPNQNESLEAQ